MRVVAPFTGAWIEISEYLQNTHRLLSLPSRERGLKCSGSAPCNSMRHVAPFTGAWIEIPVCGSCSQKPSGRSLHGSVD